MVSARTPQEQLVLDFFRILSSGDLEATRATLHADATWQPMVEGIPGAGVHGPRDKIVDEFLAPVRGLFKPGDPKTTVLRMVSGGDTVMCESRGVGTLQDGRQYDNRYAWSIDVRDGKIFAIREYMDSHYVATLLASAHNDSYDYVIAGAGTAGCVLANRLSGDDSANHAGASVALIEAGPRDSDPAIHVPAMVAKAIGNPRQSWGYQSVPQQHVDGRRLVVPRGRVLGGCSSINGMVYFRGHPRDYDDWRQPGWSHAELLPYFKRLENYERAQSAERARGGPVNVIDIPRPNPLVQRFLAAADHLGLPRCADFNSGEPEGFGARQAAIRAGRRESGVTAYLQPARRRQNLQIVTEALVTRVLFEGRRAIGIEIERGGVRSVVRARREVILACGAYGSPQLLQLSGVGEGAALQRLGIATLLDLPAVGRNLHDHPAASLAMRTANTESYGLSWRTLPRSALIAAQYLFTRAGPLASNVFEAHGFMRSRPELSRPDLQIIFMPAHRNANGHWLPRGHGYGIIFVNLRPASRGTVALASSDPHVQPAIDFNFLAQPGDLAVLVRGFEVARSLLAAPAFAPLASREVQPGPEVQSRAQVEQHIRNSLVTVHHACGSCSMGAVVDAALRVKGLEALRVVDASVIPTVVAGNSNIPVNALAERAADLILGKTS